MKIKFLLFLFCSLNLFAQNPTIEGDLMLCPNSNGTATITNDVNYETYQWYFKYWFLNDDYQPIENATESSFTYDWYTYDQALLKVVVTLNGETLESNAIQIDSYNWTPIYIQNELNEFVTVDPNDGTLLVCEGHTVDLNLPPLFSENIVWYNDGVPIEGANSLTYTVTAPGAYTVTASPNICPESSNSTNPLYVQFIDCSLSTPNPELEKNIEIYPNPTPDFIHINKELNADLNYIITDMNQKTLAKGTLTDQYSKVDMSQLSSGIYMITLYNGQHSKSYKIVKK